MIRMKKYVLPVLSSMLLSATILGSAAHAEPSVKSETPSLETLEKIEEDIQNKKAELAKARKDFYKKLENASPEDRKAMMDKHVAEREKKILKKIEQLPPEEQEAAKARFNKKKAERAEMREKMEKMTPEERAEFIKQKGDRGPKGAHKHDQH
jgi:hypothetical protein